MELELQTENYPGYRAFPAIIDAHEETAETIVPDYSPDIVRIVDASACLLLREPLLSNGKAELSGTVEVTLLYLADDALGLRSMTYSLEMQRTLEHETLKGISVLTLEGHACAPEVRLLNPRKLFTRVSVEVCAVPYRVETLSVSSGITQQADYHIETLESQHEVALLRAVREKDFVFSEELTLPGSREPIRQLLTHGVKTRINDCRPMGNKVILKGAVCVSVLYADTDGTLHHHAAELPFSQILDGLEEMESELLASASLYLTDCEVHLNDDDLAGDGRTVSVRISLHAAVTLRQLLKLRCITDLYSTSHELNVQMENVELPQLPQQMSRQMSMREQIETGSEVGSILCANVCFGGVSMSHGAEGLILRTSATIRVLYLGENGTPLCAERRREITLETDVSSADQLSVRSLCSGDIVTSLSTQGLEVRFPVEFLLITQPELRCSCLTAVQVESSAEKPQDLPNLILRALSSEETLWDLAKQYRTTVNEILTANELSDQSAAAVGELLLIPRRR